MKKKKGYSKGQIVKIKSHITRTFPYANKVDVRVRKLPNGKYQSSIQVLAPQRRELIAQKVDDDVSKSLEKSHSAIISQIHRLKTKKNKARTRSAIVINASDSFYPNSEVYL